MDLIADLRYLGAQWVEPYGDAATTGIATRDLSDRPLWNSRNAVGKGGEYTIEGWTPLGEEWLEHKETIERPKGMEDEHWVKYLAKEKKMFEWEANMKRHVQRCMVKEVQVNSRLVTLLQGAYYPEITWYSTPTVFAQTITQRFASSAP